MLERLNALTMVKFAFSVLVESGSIAVACGHAARLAAAVKSHCAIQHMPAAANPLLF
jgi:hypothetical protein